MPKVEVLAPAGSPEAVTAAVLSGADAVYVGALGHNARQYAKNFDRQGLEEAVKYCRVRGVKVYVALNTLLSDRELSALGGDIAFYAAIGTDALIVQDLGLAAYLRKAVPQIPLFASTQLSVHNLEGVKALHELGFSRAIVARELSLEDLKTICAHSPMEIECFVHGSLCMSHSGQCYMSAVIGGRSGNRGRCAQPCRLPYRVDSKPWGYPLSLKDLCLGGRLNELLGAGVASLKIEGRMKRPEYVAAATKAYSMAVSEGRNLTEDEIRELSEVFSRGGFTDRYLDRPLSDDMFGVRKDGQDSRYKRLLKTIRKGYEGERPLVPVDFKIEIRQGEPVILNASDRNGNRVTVRGARPEPAKTVAANFEKVSAQLKKTGGTPFLAGEISATIEEGLSLPASQINALRREALDRLANIRECPPQISVNPVKPLGMIPNTKEPPRLTASFLSLSQIPENCSRLDTVWLPLEELANAGQALGALLHSGVRVGAVMPRVVRDGEQKVFLALLDKIRAIGIRIALAGNIGLIRPLFERGFTVCGDFGLNIYNSRSLFALSEWGFSSATLSFELTLPVIRDIQKPIPCEMIAYGRLPLMVFEHCLSGRKCGGCNKLHILQDRKNERFLLACEFGGRNILYNSKPLYLADRVKELGQLGISALRLCFTDEGQRDCGRIIEQYEKLGEPPEGDFTRGLYYRKTE